MLVKVTQINLGKEGPSPLWDYIISTQDIYYTG